MNSRERVTRAIEMKAPDRIPLTHATLPGAFDRYGKALHDLYNKYPSDVCHVGMATYGEYGPEIDVLSQDAWGALWVRHTNEHKGQIVHCPLKNWDAFKTFAPPDTSSDKMMTEIEENITANAGELYTYADGDTLWQRMFYLHGYQATLEDLLLERKRCEELRDLILSEMIRRLEKLCRIPGLDGVHFRDDWGTQQALMIRPHLWREFFKPAYAKLFSLVRNSNKHVWFHSDGVIHEIIPDLIEIGVQVLNPQVTVIGRDCVAELCRNKVCIEADIDRQWVLPFGKPEDVRAAVQEDIDAFNGLNGGYIGRGEMAGDIPMENVTALLDEITKTQN